MLNRDATETQRLYTALLRLSRQIHRFSHYLVHSDGYYREQSRLLLLIAENDGVIQRDLAEEMDVRPSSMTEMLAKMEQLGFIERRQDEKDQRVMHIFLTEKGKNAAKGSQDATKIMTDTLFTGLSEEEIHQMLGLIEKLCTHLDATDPFAKIKHERHHGFGSHHGFGGHHQQGIDNLLS
jgi:DNA-binding MarR family transcriptional regulator